MTRARMPTRLDGRFGDAIVVGATLMAVVAIAPALESLRYGSMGALVEAERYEDIYYLPPAEWMVTLSLGHREALADLVWMKALLYFTDEIQHRGDSQNIYRYAEAILTLDPYFRRAYFWIGTAGLYRAEGVELEEMMKTVDLLERGVERFPRDGQMAWELGATLLYELAPIAEDEERARELRERGAELIQRAARLGGGPEWLALTAASTLQRLGRIERAVEHLEEMYSMVDDPGMRQQIALRLQHLRGAAEREAIERTHAAVEQARRESFPYVDRDLFLLLGERLPGSMVPPSIEELARDEVGSGIDLSDVR